jgi:hypothetical protein
MKAETQAMIERMIETAEAGHDIIPMFFQPVRGISNTVSAAIRCAVARGLLEQDGVDGCGKPKYRIPIKAETHAGTSTIN